jgi:hypothetical protein
MLKISSLHRPNSGKFGLKAHSASWSHLNQADFLFSFAAVNWLLEE